MSSSLILLNLTVPWQHEQTSAELLASTPNLPTKLVSFPDGKQVILPDLQNFTFETLPAFGEDGSYIAPSEVTDELGYDPSIYWSRGQPISEVLNLGSFEDSLQPQTYSVDYFVEKSNTSLADKSLDDFELLEWQTLKHLVDVVPGLGNKGAYEIPPVAEILINNDISARNLAFQPLKQLVQDPKYGNLKLGTLGNRLSAYNLESIPGLTGVPLEQFQDWQRNTLSQVPGLTQVPWSSFADSPLAKTYFNIDPSILSAGLGQVDIVFGPLETDRKNTISGGYLTGFRVPCSSTSIFPAFSCPHVEMTGTDAMDGKQWISGTAQWVLGGSGLTMGLEPTGRHPFGAGFKQTIAVTNEATGTAQTSVYFKICSLVGCTPYTIGPIPWIPTSEENWMFVGIDGIGSDAIGQDLSPEQISNWTDLSLQQSLDNLQPQLEEVLGQPIDINDRQAVEDFFQANQPNLDDEFNFQGEELESAPNTESEKEKEDEENWNRAWGVLQALGGLLEVVGAVEVALATSLASGGTLTIPAVLVALFFIGKGLDDVQAGLRQALSGDAKDTLFFQFIEWVTGSKEVAIALDTATSLAGIITGLAKLPKAVRRLRESIKNPEKLRDLWNDFILWGRRSKKGDSPSVKPINNRDKLIGELKKAGINHNPYDIIDIRKTVEGKIVFLEKGNSKAGFKHVIERHEADFVKRGVTREEIPNLIMEAVTKGRIVGYQGKGKGRPIYELIFNGKQQYVAVTTGSNGFIVGANPGKVIK